MKKLLSLFSLLIMVLAASAQQVSSPDGMLTAVITPSQGVNKLHIIYNGHTLLHP